MKRPALRRSLIFQAAAVLCLGIFVYLVFKMDPGRIWSAVRRLGWTSWVILMGLRTLFWVFRSVNWYWVMSRYPNRPSLSQAFLARIAGHSVGYLTPASKIGGETVRILMIDGVSKSTVVASAVVDKTIEFMAMLPLIGCSVVLLITRYTLSGPQKSAFVGSLAGAVVLMLVFFVLQKKGLLAWIFSALSRLRLRISALERHRGSIEKTDSLISEF